MVSFRSGMTSFIHTWKTLFTMSICTLNKNDKINLTATHNLPILLDVFKHFALTISYRDTTRCPSPKGETIYSQPSLGFESLYKSFNTSCFITEDPFFRKIFFCHIRGGRIFCKLLSWLFLLFF